MTKKIIELFYKKVSDKPEEVALVDNFGKKISYIQLYQDAEKISRIIKSSFVTPNSIIGIYMNRSAEMIVVILGILMSDCIYLPIDIRSPKSRVQFYLDNSKHCGIFVGDEFVDNIQNIGNYNNYKISGINFLVNIDAKSNDNSKINKESLYLIYTSGSTGHPKGVIGTNQGLINRLDWMSKTYPTDLDESCILSNSFSFVDAVADIFFPLLNGVVLHIPSEDITSNPFLLIDYIFYNKITRLVTGPTMLASMLDYIEDIDNKLKFLKILTISGQEIQAGLVRKFRQKFKDIIFLNLYGSSEVSADATYYEVPKIGYENLYRIPIGKPISNLKAYILDEEGKVVNMVNKEGEICISGIGVAQGYLNEQEENSPFILSHLEDSDRAYKTGDIGYIDENGDIIYIGRKDGQYKINGQKIHRGEIEKFAINMPEVNLAALIVNGGLLVLYIQPSVKARNNFSAEIVLKELKKNLPLYMIPNKIIVTDNIPINNNGKVNYKVLENLRIEEEEFREKYNHEELFILELFRTLLKLEKIPSKHQSFFSLGGDSLLANILISKIRSKFHYILTLNDLYNNPSVSLILKNTKKSKRSELNIFNSELVSLKKNASKKSFLRNNFIIFPTILGHHQNYNYFAKNIENSKFHELGYDYNQATDYADINKLSKCYCDYIKAHFNENDKVFLVGWSFGGILAYATTYYAVKNGIKIDGLVMLDSYNPMVFSHKSKEIEKQELYQILLKTQISNKNNSEIDRLKTIIDLNISMMWKFKPKQIKNCPVTLIKASSYNSKFDEFISIKDNGWGSLLQKLNVHIVDADHFDIFNKKHSEKLAQIFNNELDLIRT